MSSIEADGHGDTRPSLTFATNGLQDRRVQPAVAAVQKAATPVSRRLSSASSGDVSVARPAS
jgi:hypothetical protein